MFTTNRIFHLVTLLFCMIVILQHTIGASWQDNLQIQQSLGGHHLDPDQALQIPLPTRPHHSKTMPAMLEALEVMQEQYFEVWLGIWSTGIDWTAAVMGTYLSSVLMTLSSAHRPENLIDKYFAQMTAYYFGQDAVAIRQEAYDDMLWVVLGWLESVRFIELHTSSYTSYTSSNPWHGTQFTPAFAHRARLFWDFASKGWDTQLCSGGMIWSPYLEPYKNAITNELFVAASISMYLHFPGDTIDSPFSISSAATNHRDAKYLAAAIEAYKWLMNSRMTNSQGLYIDGFHISNFSDDKKGFRNGSDPNENMVCDVRNEMVYTYNQGVILTGQRGLYVATGAKSYLEQGHQLIESVIVATGYNLTADSSHPQPGMEVNRTRPSLPQWRGLGRSGILEDFCDAKAHCSQDAQTFKGIFFHHFTEFCRKLPADLRIVDVDNLGDGETNRWDRFADIAQWHDASCLRYKGWVMLNAQAALGTRDEEGRFGMWWGAPPPSSSPSSSSSSSSSPSSGQEGEEFDLPDGAVDYRNEGVPRDRSWGVFGDTVTKDIEASEMRKQGSDKEVDNQEANIMGKKRKKKRKGKDANERGRGRTLETQGGGVSVLRALWELYEGR